MHSSFKTKHNFNRRHSLNPYSRRSPFLSTSVNHKDQEFDILHRNRQGLSRSSTSTNSYPEATHNAHDTLPLKLVFSRTINMPSKQIYSDADPNDYFSRKCTEIAKKLPQPTSCSETPIKRSPLMNLAQENTTESSFHGDSFETFRSISSRHNNITSNKENSHVQELEHCFEDLKFTPPWKETCSSVQQQQKPKHMFDFGTGREVNRYRQNVSDKLMTSADLGTKVASDRHRQNASNKLMTSADFLVTASAYQCSSPGTSSVSSPHLSIPDIDEDMENLRQSLSPISSETSAAYGSKYNNIVEELELLTCNESVSGAILTPSPSPPILAPQHDSMDHLLDMNLPLSEGFLGSAQNNSHYGAIRCVHDKRMQEGNVSYFGGSGQDIVNKRCDRRGSGRNCMTRNYDVIGRNHVGRRFHQRESDQNSFNSPSNNYDDISQNYFGRRFNQGGSVRYSVNSPRNYDGFGQNDVGRRLNQQGSDRNFVNTPRKHDDIGQNVFDEMLNQESRGSMSVDRTQCYGGGVGQRFVHRSYNQVGSGQNYAISHRNHDGIGQNFVDRRRNQDGSEHNPVHCSQSYDDSGQDYIDRRYNQEGSGRYSVNNTRDHDGIGMNVIDRRCNQESGGRHSVNNSQNHDGIGVNVIERRCNQESSGRNSVNNSQNHDSIGVNCIERRCNQEGSGRNSLSMTRNSTMEHNYLESRYDDKKVMDCEESISLLSNNFYVVGNSDDKSECNSVSSEVVIPQHLLDLWRRSPTPSTNLLQNRQENDHHLSTDILISDDDGDIAEDNVDDVNEHIVVNCDGSATEGYGSAISQLRSGEVGKSVNHASWTSKKGFVRIPFLSDPDEE